MTVDIAIGRATSIEPVTNRVSARELSELPPGYCVARWYAAYTSANHEKRVVDQLSLRQIENFVPLYESVRRWKDRRVSLQLPLFPGYVFVRMALRDKLRVVQLPGVARLVAFNGVPAALPEEAIAALRNCLAKGIKAQPHPFLAAGRPVRVKQGPLAGMVGTLVRKKNATRLVMSLDVIARSVAVEIDAVDLEPFSG
jgi:transcription antitermination factor NusG